MGDKKDLSSGTLKSRCESLEFYKNMILQIKRFAIVKLMLCFCTHNEQEQETRAIKIFVKNC